MIYDRLAKVYEKLIGFDHRGYTAFIAPYLHGEGIDLACGSGSATRLLAERGLKMTGVDISAEMLKEAARRGGAQWVCADISRLRLPAESYDFAVCVCDGFNYLSPRALARTIAGVRSALKPGGVLAFDVSTPFKLKSLLGNKDFFYEDGGIYLGWNNFFGRGACDVQLTWFVPAGGDKFEKHEEDHRLYAHEKAFLQKLLKGFEIKIYDGENYGAVKARCKRWLFLCKKV